MVKHLKTTHSEDVTFSNQEGHRPLPQLGKISTLPGM